jgi:putative hydroxymethylpyrimidine transport system ATP-binding protein
MQIPNFHIQLSAATLGYGEDWVFDGLDLNLEGGRWTCILGQSGVGKTSLLRMLAGLIEPSYCSARLNCSDGLPLEGRFAYLSQEDLLLPWLTALDNVTLGARLRGVQRKAETAAAMALLNKVGLGGKARLRPQQLSGGMRQRVALARTLMEDRPVVFMDEPFSALDAVTRLRLQDLAAELLRDRTVLHITHDPMEALRLGHCIYTLNGSPARLSSPLVPRGAIPRRIDDPAVLSLQAKLLAQLADRPHTVKVSPPEDRTIISKVGAA